ncbi:MAG TPA: hypothetical protein VL485_10215 [Ktedonobacteraceae bacterium]|nr:hypothetical protein [Ktedonobacteraceae bacterium]
MTIRITRVIIGIAGLGALLLGLLFWIANINLISIHMLFGLIVAITLLIMSIIATSTRGMRIWGIVGIVYAVILPIFGVTQANLLPGDLHWLIQSAHLLLGIGALALAGMMSVRYLALKPGRVKSSVTSQMVQQEK